MIGKIVSHYRIIDQLGRGGMGEVFLAEDTSLGRRVAIKFPRLDSDERDFRARFLREARSVSELRNPHIATLYDYGETEEGHPFLVMEFVRGENLSDLVRRGELTVPRALEIVELVATALEEAHGRGIVHRDIKPSNIMVDERGQVKVLDFGLAKQLKDYATHESEPEAKTLLAMQTRSGALVGTPAYLSPEQAMGRQVDVRSDLFAVGGVLYECLTGRPAFIGANVIEIASNVIHVEPVWPSKVNSSLSPQLDSIVMKALAKKPDKRYQTAADLILDLRTVRTQLENNLHNTLIKPKSEMLAARSVTLTNLSQMLRRPRVPLWQILVGVVLLVGIIALGWRWLRPPLHTPPAEARNWYEVGTNALRDGAFFQASKALEQAVTIDDKFVLAHARLAESLVELDFTDRAKDELLKATTLAGDRSRLPRIDGLYVDAISATVRHDFASAVGSYAEIARTSNDTEKPRALVDLGRAHEKNEELKKAIETYTEAANRSTQYATAFLRLGVLYGRQRDLANASTALDKAESIYQANGNLEGRTEVVYQRGALLNQLGKLSDSKIQLDQALTLAGVNNNASQKIKILLQLSTVSVDAGDTARAMDYAREAVDLAQKNGMENLSAQGLTDLGYSFQVRGQSNEADRYFLQALESAQRVKARNNEARARAAIANLRQQQNKPDEVIQYLEPALSFYQKGGYRSAAASCLAILSRAHIQKGDYATAETEHEQLLKLGQESNDQSVIALAHAERGSALMRQERFTEALDHLTQAYNIYISLGIQRSAGYNLLDRARTLIGMGRYDEAEGMLSQALAIADKGDFKRLALEGRVAFAEIALAQQRFADAGNKAKELLGMTGNEFPGVSANVTRVLGLAMAYGGNATAGKQKCAEAVELTNQLNDSWQLARAQLALAEATLLAGDAPGAVNVVLQADEVFALIGQTASEWRALAVAALANQKSGDKNKAQEYAGRANEALSKLEQSWGRDNRDSFLARPDTARFKKQIDQIAAAVK